MFLIGTTPTIIYTICGGLILGNFTFFYHRVRLVYNVTINDAGGYVCPYQVGTMFGVVLLWLVYYKGNGDAGLVGAGCYVPRLMVAFGCGRCPVTLFGTRQLGMIYATIEFLLGINGNGYPFYTIL